MSIKCWFNGKWRGAIIVRTNRNCGKEGWGASGASPGRGSERPKAEQTALCSRRCRCGASWDKRAAGRRDSASGWTAARRAASAAARRRSTPLRTNSTTAATRRDASRADAPPGGVYSSPARSQKKKKKNSINSINFLTCRKRCIDRNEMLPSVVYYRVMMKYGLSGWCGMRMRGHWGSIV